MKKKQAHAELLAEARSELSRAGGLARAKKKAWKKTPKARRKEIAVKAARARWKAVKASMKPKAAAE